MALRVMVYLGLFYQDLIRRRELTEGGKLPPVLPLVLYNGRAPWSAAQDVTELIEDVPGGLEQYRPQLRYCLLDEVRIADSELESLRNLAAALFRLEKSRSPQDIERVLEALVEWLWGDDLKELRESFTLWLLEVLIPARIPGMTVPKVADLQEVKTMLAERVMEWTEQWKQEGLEAGRNEGLQKVRTVLLGDLEKRFGPLPDEIRQRIAAIDSIEELTLLSLRVGSISSLADLELS